MITDETHQVNTEIYKPEYYEDIPPESGGLIGDCWYATTVLEFIISYYRYACPELYAAIWDKYVGYCHAHGAYPGEMSPILGVFSNGWKVWFIARYLRYPVERSRELLRKLSTNMLEAELNFWNRFSRKE